MKRLYILMILVFQIHFMSAQILKNLKKDGIHYDMKEVLVFENVSFTEKDTLRNPLIYFGSVYKEAIKLRRRKKYKQSNSLFYKLSNVRDTLNSFFNEAGYYFDTDRIIMSGLKGLANNYYIQKQYDKARELYEKTLELEMKHNSKEFVSIHYRPKRKIRKKFTKLDRENLEKGYLYDFEELEIKERIKQIKNGTVKDRR